MVKKLKAADTEAVFPKYISRHEDGPHNDDKHDCYLTLYSDEWGYTMPTIFSSLEISYFDHLDDGDSIFDPLLAHSNSAFYKALEESKDQHEYSNKPDFPMNYVAYWDCYSNVDEWMTVEESNHTCFLPKNYILTFRDVLNRHFDPTAEPMIFPEDIA